MVLGQNITTLLYDNFRLSVRMDTVNPYSDNVEVQSPQSTFEQLTGASAASVELTPVTTNLESNTVAVKLIAVYPRSYSPDTSAFVSSPLLLQVQAQDAEGGAAVKPSEFLSNIEFTFQHNEHQYQYLHHAAVNFTTMCTKRNESERYSFVCPESGHVLSHNCSQGAGVHTSYCPKPAPGCAKLGVDSADISIYAGCVAVSYNLTYTTCACQVRPLNSSAARFGRRMLTITGEELLDDSGATNMMVATVFIANDFADTFTAADDFTSPNDAKRVLIAITMLGVLWMAALLFIVIDWLKSAKVQAPEEKKGPGGNVEAQKSVTAYIASTIPEVFDSDKSAWSRLWSELLSHHDIIQFWGDQSTQQRRLIVAKTVTMLTFALFLTAAFFDVSGPDNDGSCGNHTTEDSCLKRTCPFDYSQTYCKWNESEGDDSEACAYNTQPMSMTALFYLTVVITILTTIATIPLDYLFGIISAPTALSLTGLRVMHVIQAAVNGARRLTQRRTTVVKPADEQNRSSKPQASDKLIVSREVPEDMVHASTAARASIAVVERNSIAIKRRASNAAPSLIKVQASARTLKLPPQLESAEKMNITTGGGAEASRPPEQADAQRAISSASSPPVKPPNSTLPLSSEVIEQRRMMNDGAEETLLFDAQWGVETEPFAHQSRLKYQLAAEAVTAINADVLAARKEARKLCEVLPNYNEHHAGLEILHLFMVDLLGRNTPAAKIFQEKFGEDFGSSKVVLLWDKICAAIFLVLLNAFFMYFILLMAFQKGLEWQIQYLVCYIIQFAIDFMIFQTLEVVWFNYSLPEIVNEEVALAVRTLRAHVDCMAATTDIHTVEEGGGEAAGEAKYYLNSTEHLFVSAHVAKKFPELLESMIVSSYINHLPGEICRTWPHYLAKSKGEAQRQEQQVQVQRAAKLTFHPRTWWLILPVIMSTVSYSLQQCITIPYLYQRVIIRFVQPIVFSAVCIVWYMAVQNVISAVVLGALCVACVLYVLRRRYLKRKAEQSANHTVVPEPQQSVPDENSRISRQHIPTYTSGEASTALAVQGDSLTKQIGIVYTFSESESVGATDTPAAPAVDNFLLVPPSSDAAPAIGTSAEGAHIDVQESEEKDCSGDLSRGIALSCATAPVLEVCRNEHAPAGEEKEKETESICVVAALRDIDETVEGDRCGELEHSAAVVAMEPEFERTEETVVVVAEDDNVYDL